MSSPRHPNPMEVATLIGRDCNVGPEPTYSEHPRVPPGSRLALFVSMIERGESMGGAARRSGLSATQLFEWMEQDSMVAAEVDSTRGRIERQVRIRLMSLAHTAVDVVERALARSDAATAIALLAGLGFIGGESETPAESETG